MRRLLAFLAAVFVCLAGTPATAAAPAPKLVIVISVDQFASHVYRRYESTYTGGLKRLSSGVAYPVGYQSHAATETCPGHSTILTGDHPARTGIVGNSWIERATGKSVYCVDVPGIADSSAVGPQRLRVTTLGDWMKAAYPGSRVISVSGKDRAAIMLGGHYADLVAWWVNGVGFATSPFAASANEQVRSELRQWDQALRADWQAHRPELWPADIADRCRKLEAPLTVGPVHISGKLPPLQSRGVTKADNFFDSPEFASQLHASPLFDSLTLDLAADLARDYRLGSRPSPDLLAISLSATDYVGHRYGPGGPQMCEQVNALDQSLATFFARIDALHVPYVVALTADHGSMDAAERARVEGLDAQRMDPHAFVAALNQHLRQALGIDYDAIAGGDPEQLYVQTRGDAKLHDRGIAEALSWLRQQPQVTEALTAAQVAASAPDPRTPASEWTTAQRFYESYDPDRSGDIMVEYRKSESFGIPRESGASVAGHGSPWDYDRQVPILFWWPGVTPRTLAVPAQTVDIAPTLAALLGISPPDVDGRCLDTVAACPGLDGPRAP